MRFWTRIKLPEKFLYSYSYETVKKCLQWFLPYYKTNQINNGSGNPLKQENIELVGKFILRQRQVGIPQARRWWTQIAKVIKELYEFWRCVSFGFRGSEIKNWNLCKTFKIDQNFIKENFIINSFKENQNIFTFDNFLQFALWS